MGKNRKNRLWNVGPLIDFDKWGGYSHTAHQTVFILFQILLKRIPPADKMMQPRWYLKPNWGSLNDFRLPFLKLIPVLISQIYNMAIVWLKEKKTVFFKSIIRWCRKVFPLRAREMYHSRWFCDIFFYKNVVFLRASTSFHSLNWERTIPLKRTIPSIPEIRSQFSRCLSE